MVFGTAGINLTANLDFSAIVWSNMFREKRMTQINSHLFNCIVADTDRAKAQIKYEIKNLESSLHQHINASNELAYYSSEVIDLCDTLANKFLDYLRLLDDNIEVHFPAPKVSSAEAHWPEHFNLLQKLKQKLSKTIDLEEEKEFLIKIATLYQQVKFIASADATSKIGEPLADLKYLFHERKLNLWLEELVHFWNQHDAKGFELVLVFADWSIKEQKLALDFFADPEFIDLVHAIFFYKLYPDKLFYDLLHPEKLVSVRMRLAVLHHYIELIQDKLHKTALQNGLMPVTDYLLHKDELPHGIMIEVNEEFREMIQAAVKKLNVTFTPEHEKQATLERLSDLVRAYQFWFNPNRLIDAVMVLQQRLVPETIAKECKIVAFQKKMVQLYHQLTTTECLDLYGYFANNDTQDLVNALFIVTQGVPLDWLLSVTDHEKNSLTDVFLSLQTAMEALRIELKNRHVAAAPYMYDLARQFLPVSQRNRDVVFRIMALYGQENLAIGNPVEKLFRFVEDIH